MSKQTINIGASPNDGTGTPLRTSFDYTNQNFTEIYTALGGGVALPGATTQVIFNDGGTNLAGDAGLVYNKTTDALTVAGLVTAGSATITGALTTQSTPVKLASQTASDCTVFIGPDVPTATRSGRIGFITSSSEKNWFIANNWNISGGFEITQSTAAGGSTMSTNPTFRISNNSDFLFLDGAGGTRMTLNSTGLGLGGTPSGVNRFAVFNGATQALTLDTSGNLLVGTVTSPTGTKIGSIAKLSSVSVEGTGSISVSTTPVALARITGTGGLYFVAGFNTTGGAQCWFLVASTGGGTPTVIASTNLTGLTVAFTMVGGVLSMNTVSGTISVTALSLTS